MLPQTLTRSFQHTLLLAFVVALVPSSGLAALTTSQQACVSTLNKDLEKVTIKLGNEVLACVKDFNRAKNAVVDVQACVDDDRKGRVEKARQKTLSNEGKKCGGNDNDGVPKTPSVLYNGGAAVNAAADETDTDLLEAVYGSVIAPIDDATDKDAARCQEAMVKRLRVCQKKQINGFRTCGNRALKEGQDPFTAGSESPIEVDTCVFDDPKGKVAKVCDLGAAGDSTVDKIRLDLDKKCVAKGVDLGTAFPGCVATDIDGVHDCFEARVTCSACEAVNAASGLSAPCDQLDNGVWDGSCGGGLVVNQDTIDLPSTAEPAETPGSPGVVLTNPDVITILGGAGASLNNARYTRYFLEGEAASTPDSILVLVPGFEGGAGTFRIFAENLIRRARREKDMLLEVWGFDRRSNQLEDLVGLNIAETNQDAAIALDWLFGSELGLALSPELSSGPNRRAVFLDTSVDTAFMANWTPLVHSQDIDAVVEEARNQAANANVFLGGHSAGTGFTARYASTDFNLSGVGAPDPGYAKVRGLVLIEGGGGSSAGTSTTDELDRAEDRFDGGLYQAVLSQAPSCVDGTPCTVVTEAVDCAGLGNATCTEPTSAYAVVAGLLNSQILSAVEVVAIQGIIDPDSGENLLTTDQGAPGNNAVAVVPELATLSLLPKSTVFGGLGSFLDDDGLVASFASFVSTSLGGAGATVGGLLTWQTRSEVIDPSFFVDNGPAPTSLPTSEWGVEQEATSLDRLLPVFYQGETNFTDWYYPSSGLGVTNGIPSMDTEALSADPPLGRGRRDIANNTQAAAIDIPVIGVGGSIGLSRSPASFVSFGQSLGTCTAPSCDGATPRVVDSLLPNEAFPTLGDVAGGYEVHMTEGYSHVDILTAEDDEQNNVVGPVLDFLDRNRL